jgi:hypothetical protein
MPFSRRPRQVCFNRYLRSSGWVAGNCIRHSEPVDGSFHLYLEEYFEIFYINLAYSA